MSSVNRVILIGNVGRDPEIRSMANGNRVCNFSLATSEHWTDKQSGEKKEKTEWHNVVIFNDGLVGVVEKYVRKGSKLYIEGQLQSRNWTDKNGVERYTTEVVLQKFRGQIVLLDGAKAKGETQSQSQSQGHTDHQAPLDGLDDEIPFS